MAEIATAPELKTVVAPTIKPVASTTLPKEVEDKSFSADDFEVEQLPEQVDDKAAKPTTAAEDKSTKPKVEEKPKVDEEKKEDEEEVVEDEEEKPKEEEKKLPSFLKPPKGKEDGVKPEDKGGVKPIVPKAGARDFTGFTKEEADAGRQMSNEAFAIYQKALKTNKELSTLKNQSYIQHPDAYVLDPEYQQTRTDLTFAQKEASYWEQQLINMSENGTEVIPLTGFDSKTGAPICGIPIKPSKALELKLQQMIGNCNQVSQQLQGKLQQYPTKYKDTVSTDLKAVEDYRAQQFGWVKDPTLLDYTIPIEGIGERSLKQVREDVQSMLPKWMHSHPLVPVLGDLVIALRIKQAELAEKLSNAGVEQIKKEEQELVEPSSKAKATAKGKGAKVHGVDEFIIDPNLGV